MGALNSRRTTMSRSTEEDSSPAQIEDTSESDDSDIEAEYEIMQELRARSRATDHDGTAQFVALLRNLVSSGALVMDHPDDEETPPVTRKPPKIKYKINTSILDKSEFSLITRRDAGLLECKDKGTTINNVATLLRNREYGCHKQTKLSPAIKSKISNDYLPNKMVATIDQSAGKLFCGVFSPDGNTFLTASQDCYIRIYDSSDCTYKKLKSIKAAEVFWSLLDVAFSPDGEHCVYSTWSSNIHMCQVSGDSELQEPFSLVSGNRRFCIFSVEYSGDGRELVCGAKDSCIYLYDLERKKCTSKIFAHAYDVNRVLFADNGSHIIYSGGDDGLVKVWDRRAANDGNAAPVGIFAGHMDGVTYIDSRGDGRHLISNSKDQSIKLWDLRLFSNDAAATESINSAQNQRWDYRWQGVPKRLYEDKKLLGDTSIMTFRGHVVSKTLIRARFSPAETTGQRFIYTGCSLGRLIVYDTLTGKMVCERKGHMSCVRDVAWHPTRNEIVTTSWDGMVGEWGYTKSSSRAPAEPLRRSARLAVLRARQQSDSTSSD